MLATPQSFNVPSGLSLICLPYDYSADPFHFDGAAILDLPVSTVLPFTAKLATYDGARFAYAAYPDLPGGSLVGSDDLTGRQTLPGVGYWVRELSAVAVSQLGALVASPLSVTLYPGWNLVGDPYTVTLDASGLQFAATSNVGPFAAGATETLAQAQANNLTPGILFGHRQHLELCCIRNLTTVQRILALYQSDGLRRQAGNAHVHVAMNRSMSYAESALDISGVGGETGIAGSGSTGMARPCA